MRKLYDQRLILCDGQNNNLGFVFVLSVGAENGGQISRIMALATLTSGARGVPRSFPPRLNTYLLPPFLAPSAVGGLRKLHLRPVNVGHTVLVHINVGPK